MTAEPCTDPTCKFNNAHVLGRLSPRFNELIDGCLLMAMEPIEYDGNRLAAFKHRLTRATIYIDSTGEAFGFTEHGMIRFASPGEAIGALCDDPVSRFD